MTEQTDRLGNLTGKGAKCNTLHGGNHEGELENGVNGSLLADYLAIYITTRNQRVASRALREVTNKLNE